MFTLPFVIHIANYCSYPICFQPLFIFHMFTLPFVVHIANYCSYPICFKPLFTIHIPYVHITIRCSHHTCVNHDLLFISHMFTLPFVIHIANYCSYPICFKPLFIFHMFTLPFVIHIENYCSYPICFKPLFTIHIPYVHITICRSYRELLFISHVLNHYLLFVSHMFTLPFVVRIANYCSYPICFKPLFTIRIPYVHITIRRSYRELLFISHMF